MGTPERLDVRGRRARQAARPLEAARAGAAGAPDVRTPAPGPRGDDVSVVTRGARWFTIAYFTVGIVNYGYALVMTRLLDVGAYARFAAGQGLLLFATTVAAVSVPWVLAQALARARTDDERAVATRFATVAATVGGFLVAVGVTCVAVTFANGAALVSLALSAWLIFTTMVVVGDLQGRERMGVLATLGAAEPVVKFAAGVVLVAVAHTGDAGALAAFGIGALPLLFWWPRGAGGATGRGRKAWKLAARSRGLWRQALGIGRLQGVVAVLVASDAVLATVLPGSRSSAAGYQAALTLARVPLFVSSAVGMAFFPALARRGGGAALRSRLTGGAARMYLLVTLPLTAVLVTVPDAVLGRVFPSGFGQVGTYLIFTSVAGLAIGAINLVVTFAQADDDFGIIRQQLVGAAAYVAALLVGWRADGLRGMAVGAACGGLFALALLVVRLVRRNGSGVFGRSSLTGLVLEPLAAAAVLFALRPLPVVWTVAALAVGGRAVVVFLRGRRERAGS